MTTETARTISHSDECATLCPVPEGEKCRIGHACWCADLMALFDSPDAIGASEYRAIYDCIEDALDPSGEEVAADPATFALAMLDEFIAHASAMRARLVVTD